MNGSVNSTMNYSCDGSFELEGETGYFDDRYHCGEFMSELTILVEIVKSIGFPGLIFFIWYLYHKSQVKTFEKIIDEQSKREERNFNLLKDMLETNQFHTSLLVKIAEKLDSKQFCAMSNRGSKKE